MKKTFLMTLALLCAVAQGAWAQTEVGTEAALTEVINGDGSNKAVKMTADITLGSRLNIVNGKNVTLDLNGHTLARSLSSAADDGNVIRVETGGQLTVKDGSGNNSGQITGGKAINGGGICNHGTLTFESGSIFNCSASSNGGGIYNAPATAGGYPTSLTIKGGTVTGNTCGDRGAGIFNYPGCVLNIQGTVDVSGNTKGSEANNVYLDGETVFTVTGALTGSHIGVSIEQSSRTVTSGYKTNNPTADGAAFFSSDNSQFGIVQDDDEMVYGTVVTCCVRSWDETNKQVITASTTKACTSLTGKNDEWQELGTEGKTTWYCVKEDIERRTIHINGEVHIVMFNNEFNLKHIKLEAKNNATLHIHSVDGSEAGTINVNNWEEWAAYGDYDQIRVYLDAAAIGGGEEESMGTLVVHGSTINADQVDGHDGNAGLKINSSAVIGGGYKGGGGTFIIYGGRVKADGDKWDDGSEAVHGGPGIGAGYEGEGGAVYIYGGVVEALGNGKCSAIGGAYDGYYSTIEFAPNMRVTAGNVNYKTISHPGGSDSSGHEERIYESISTERVFTSEERVGACWYRRWAKVEPCSHTTPTEGSDLTEAVSYTNVNKNKHTMQCRYCTYTEEQPHVFVDNSQTCVCGQRYADTLAEVTLIDAQDNTTTLTSNNGKVVNVTLDGRTLYKDGSWNTLCLPFDVADIYDTPLASLEGVIVKTLSSSDYDGTTKTLTLNFGEAISSLKAGVPYIIKWNATGDPINRPRFECVTISNTLTPVTTDYVNFVGSISPVSLTGGDKSVLYLGADSKLYYPSSDMTVGSCRALFQLKDIIAGDQPAGARSFVCNFGDGETATGIIGIGSTRTDTDKNDGYWYDLQGRKLSGKPTQKGIYINHGNKVVIK